MCNNCESSFSSAIWGYEELPLLDRDTHVNRTISIWHPANLQTSNAYPVIVLSHGYSGNPHQLAWLIHDLVINNFIVIGITHRDSSINHWKRPQDISAILDEFTARAKIGHAADLGRVGIAGFSLGGATGIWLIGGRATKLENIAPGEDYASPIEFGNVSSLLDTLDKENMKKSWQDPRIKAAFLMAPAWSWIFGEHSLQAISTPTYIVAPAADQVLVTEKNSGFFAEHLPNSSYKIVPGHHYVFLSDPNSDERTNLQKEISHLAVEFFRTTL